MKRCQWAYNERLIAYHDHIWGIPQHDETQLYKMLVLEGLQAGLSWDIILKKKNYMIRLLIILIIIALPYMIQKNMMS